MARFGLKGSKKKNEQIAMTQRTLVPAKYKENNFNQLSNSVLLLSLEHLKCGCFPLKEVEPLCSTEGAIFEHTTVKVLLLSLKFFFLEILDMEKVSSRIEILTQFRSQTESALSR